MGNEPPLQPEQTREELLEHIAQLESVLRGIQNWSGDTATDLSATGYDQWRLLVPPGPSHPVEVASPPGPYDANYRMDQWVNTHIRSAVDELATAIQTLVISFHTHRGDTGIERDIHRAKQIIKSAHDRLWKAQLVFKKRRDGGAAKG
jgi:hypothetical protein